MKRIAERMNAKQPSSEGLDDASCSPLDYRQLYETECKDHAFMRKTLDRVIKERDDAINLAADLEGGLRDHGWTIVKTADQRDALANYIERIADDADDCGDEILANQMRRFVSDTIAKGI